MELRQTNRSFGLRSIKATKLGHIVSGGFNENDSSGKDFKGPIFTRKLKFLVSII